VLTQNRDHWKLFFRKATNSAVEEHDSDASGAEEHDLDLEDVSPASSVNEDDWWLISE
jgi:hypothetical protein